MRASINRAFSASTDDNWAKKYFCHDGRRVHPAKSSRPPPYYNRGATYANIGQYERAIQDIDEAIRIDPQNAYFSQMRGQFHQAL